MTNPTHEVAADFSDVPVVAKAPEAVKPVDPLAEVVADPKPTLVAPSALPVIEEPSRAPRVAPPPKDVKIDATLAARLEAAVWKHAAMTAQYQGRKMAVELAIRAVHDAEDEADATLRELRVAREKLGSLAAQAGVDMKRQWVVDGEKGTVVYNDPPPTREGMRMPDGSELKDKTGKPMPRPKDPKA